MTRYSDLTALVIHVRAYRETSAIVQFFTQEQGRLVGVMKGLRRGRNPVQVQPFSFGKLSCSGRGNMMTVTGYEAGGHFDLTGDALSAGFYVLELLTRCLDDWQCEPQVFAATHKVLTELEHDAQLAPVLRVFEMDLLSVLGYGFDYSHAASSGAEIETDAWYASVAEEGFVPAEAGGNSIPGWVILAMGRRDFTDRRVVRVAKQLNQQALAPLIGAKPLVSRSLMSGARRSPHV